MISPAALISRPVRLRDRWLMAGEIIFYHFNLSRENAIVANFQCTVELETGQLCEQHTLFRDANSHHLWAGIRMCVLSACGKYRNCIARTRRIRYWLMIGGTCGTWTGGRWHSSDTSNIESISSPCTPFNCQHVQHRSTHPLPVRFRSPRRRSR